jgi:hypothetical protein
MGEKCNTHIMTLNFNLLDEKHVQMRNLTFKLHIVSQSNNLFTFDINTLWNLTIVIKIV